MTYARSVTARLVDTDGTTVITGTPLANSFDQSFLDEISGPGHGSCALSLSEAGAAQLTPGRFIQILVEGTPRFSLQIEGDPQYSQIAEGEEVDQVVTVSGRGWACILDQAIVYPEAPLDLRIDTSWRLFSFASPSFPNDSGWTAADELYEYLDGVSYGYRRQYAPDGFLYPSPIGFPFPISPNNYDALSPPGASYQDTYWIWPTGEELSVGYAFFRNTFTLAATTNVTFALTADNLFTLYLEGVPILGETDDTLVWLGWKEVSIELTAGTYTVAVVAENYAADLAVNPGGMIFDAYETADGTPTTLILASDATWDAWWGGDTWPGWTPGQIVAKLTAEATARSSLVAYVGDTFGDLVDTDSNAWDSIDTVTTSPYVPSFAVPVGTTIMKALEQLHDEGYVDWHVKPDTLTLDMWAGGQVGTTPGVTFAYGTNITTLERGETDVYANALLVQWDKGYVEVEDAAEIAAYGNKVEDIYSVSASSASDAEKQGRIELQRRAAEAWPAIIMGIEPTSSTDCPYEGINLGDTVTIPNTSGGTTTAQILSISLSTDDEGNAIWVLELNRRWRVPERREADLFRQIGGRSGLPSGVVN